MRAAKAAATAAGGTRLHRGVVSFRASDGAEGIFVDVCTVDMQGDALCRAVGLGSLRLVRTLVEGGYDVNSRNADGQTPLIVLCIASHAAADAPLVLQTLRYLTAVGADVNAHDRFGKTALMYAAALQCDAELVGQLLHAGAKLFVEDHLGFTALIYAYNTRNEAVMQVLRDYCVKHGREMVMLETRLNTNFLSYLKIQKLVGASRSTVAYAPAAAERPRRRFSGISDKLSTWLSVGGGGSASASISRRRTSSSALDALEGQRSRSRSVGNDYLLARRIAQRAPPSNQLSVPQHHVGGGGGAADAVCTTCGAVRSTARYDKEVQCSPDEILMDLFASATRLTDGDDACNLPQICVN